MTTTLIILSLLIAYSIITGILNYRLNKAFKQCIENLKKLGNLIEKSENLNNNNPYLRFKG